MANLNSRLIYDGPNVAGTDDIIVLLTGIDQRSINAKTKDMAQVYILNRRESPTIAVATGSDESVCGQCFLRPIISKQLKEQGDSNIPCYVDKARGPAPAWKSWHDGNVASITPLEASALVATLKACDCAKTHPRRLCKVPGKALGIRLGAYGDPASVPDWVWRDLLSMLSGKMTSYTHQWEDHPELADYTMASIDPITWPDVDAALDKAHALGFRTYRVLATGEAPRSDEMMCPEANSLTNCNKCGLCAGNMRPNTPSIVIPAIRPGPARV
jgi:hypothetical protein